MLAVITGYRVRLSVNSSVFPIVVKSQPVTVPEYGTSIEPKTLSPFFKFCAEKVVEVPVWVF